MTKQTNKLFITSLFSLAVLFTNSVAQAQQAIATIDIPKIVETLFKDSSQGQAIEKRKESETARLLKKKSEIEGLESSLREKKASSDSAEAEVFRQKVRDYQRELTEMEESLGKDMGKIQKEIIEKIKTAVDRIAAERKISLVLSKSAAAPSVVLYSNNTADLTEDVLDSIQ